jgi:uncharacterized protein YjbI with pentapeptide repeats
MNSSKIIEEFSIKKRFIWTLLFLFLTPNLYGYKPEDLGKIRVSKNCSKCDLSGANFYEADLQEVNLNGAILHHANLRRSNLSGADLSGATLFRADLFGADLTNTNLEGAKFCNTILPLGSISVKDC